MGPAGLMPQLETWSALCPSKSGLMNKNIGKDLAVFSGFIFPSAIAVHGQESVLKESVISALYTSKVTD